MNRLKRAISNKLFSLEGGKKTLNKNAVFAITAFILPLGVISYVLAESLSYQDTSHLSQSPKPISSKGNINNTNQTVTSRAVSNGNEFKTDGKTNSITARSYRPAKINFKASQVINRSGKEQKRGLPIGSNLIGKLISSIDTRDSNVLIKVLLPYGGKFKTGQRIPRDTLLLGQVSYSGSGEKIFLKFNRGVTPDGEEFEIEAQALNSKDYSSGILGEYHGNTGVRVATTLGLTAISTATGILTKKVAIGQGGAMAPAATMNNAMYGAVSKVTEDEAKRQAQELTEEKPYVTIDSGKDLIISLTKSLTGDLFE